MDSHINVLLGNSKIYPESGRQVLVYHGEISKRSSFILTIVALRIQSSAGTVETTLEPLWILPDQQRAITIIASGNAAKSLVPDMDTEEPPPDGRSIEEFLNQIKITGEI
jgi:hypothetical protein